MSWRWIAISIAALSYGPAALGGQELAVELASGDAQWVRRDTALELRVSGFPEDDEGRLAVLIGTTDVSELFRRTPQGLIYRPELMLLPVGESEIAVFVVSPQGQWREIARQPLQVLAPGGFQRREVTPRLDLGVKGQLDEGHAPPDNAPARTSYQDLTLQLDVGAGLTRGEWTIDPTLNVVGVSHRPEALRFGDEGEDAPKVDLSSYTVRVGRGQSWFQLGQVSFGNQRHLISGFGSRGAQLWTPIAGGRAELSLGAANGTQVVGWDNIVGLADSDHQVLSGALGFELLPTRPGGLRAEASYLDGSLLPRFGFNDRSVNDAETSRGWGVRLLASTPSGRARFEGGWASSRFENPSDPTLAQGADLVAVRAETKDAFYVDLGFGLLQKTLPRGKPLALDLAVRHERVDPLYRSVAASAQADLEQSSAELSGTAGPLAFQLQGSRSEDNLDRVPSILTTKTRRAGGNLALPLAELGGAAAKTRPWLPLLTYAYDRTHQFGEGVPPDGDFAASHVPDQVSVNQSAGLDWQGGRWQLGYRLTLSEQDNRQVGRQDADFETSVHGVNLTLAAHARLDLGIESSREESDNLELSQTETTQRYGLSFQWRATPVLTFAGTLSRSERDDDPRTSESEDTGVDVQGTWRFERRHGDRHGWSGQLFLRYAEQSATSRDRVFGFATDVETWTLTSGLNLSIH